MKERINGIVKIVGFGSSYSGQWLFVAVGILMVIGTLLKLSGVFYVDSDWYWFIAGLGLIVEGTISIARQEKFNKKYKILSKEEFDRLTGIKE
jgi:hypothetical protein